MQGSMVQVLNSFMSSNQQNPVSLPRGDIGVVETIDKDGDAFIQFGSTAPRQWVNKKNFPNLCSHQEAAAVFSPGAWVRAKYTTKVHGSKDKGRHQVAKGDIGYVKRLDEDGDAYVAFHGFKDSWVLRKEWCFFDIVPPGHVEDAKKLVPVPGSKVRVRNSFMSANKDTSVSILAGDTGVVDKIDEEGDAYIQFSSIPGKKQWVRRNNFPDISEMGGHVLMNPNTQKSKVQMTECNEIKAWLLQSGILAGDIEPIIARFNLPQYQVKTLPELFALEDQDIDEILQTLPLGKKRVITKMIQEQKTGIPMV